MSESVDLEALREKILPEATRCKLRCQSITTYGHGSIEVKMQAEYDLNIREDVNFNAASPNAMFSVMVDNPSVKGFFEPGKAYYLDLTKAPDLPDGALPAPGSKAEKEGLVANGTGYWRKPTQEEIDNRTPAISG